MARLTDLPNETTLIIVPLIHPDDVESVTPTCRRIYNLATEVLKRHRDLKKNTRYTDGETHTALSSAPGPRNY